MNFFGHALVASWSGSDPRWAFGAMAPDFASMSRARLAGADDPVVAAGIALHHRTDDVFHAAPTFTSIYGEGIEALERRGVSRGPARAVAHVGTELLLDGLLLDDGPTCDLFLEAVAPLNTRHAGLQFRGDGAVRFAAMQERLSRYGLPEDYRHPGRVAERMRQILARRPRLALSDAEVPRIVPWLEQTQRELGRRLDDLLAELRDGLGAPGALPVDRPRSARAILPGPSK